MKFLKISNFCYFRPKLGQHLALISFKYDISSCICRKFPLRCLHKHYFLLKRDPPCKIWKTPIDTAHFITFFTTLDLIHFDLFASIQWTMLGDSIIISNFNWNPVVLKKNLLKPQKVSMCKNGVPMGHTQDKKQLFLQKYQSQLYSS